MDQTRFNDFNIESGQAEPGNGSGGLKHTATGVVQGHRPDSTLHESMMDGEDGSMQTKHDAVSEGAGLDGTEGQLSISDLLAMIAPGNEEKFKACVEAVEGQGPASQGKRRRRVPG